MSRTESVLAPETQPGPKTVLTFPGQGSQKVGMGLDMVQRSPEVAGKIYREADRILGFSISRLSFEGPAGALDKTRFSQPAILVKSLCHLRMLEVTGQLESQQIVITAGHSLGEYAALVAAGSINFRDALLLVKERGALMEMAGEKNKGGLVAVTELNDEDIDRLHNFGLVPALFNSPHQTIFGGPDKAIERAAEHYGRRLRKLPVSCAPHTSLMEPAVEPFARTLEKVDLRDLSVPIITNASAEPATKVSDVKRGLVEQLTQPVLWRQTLEYLDKNGINKSINVGDVDTTAKWHHKTAGGVIVGTLLTAGMVGAYVWRKHSHESKS